MATQSLRDNILFMELNIQRLPITCEIDAKTYRGTYWVAGKILTVATGMAGKSRQIGSAPNEVLARQLLEVMARDGKAYLDAPRPTY